MYLIAFGYHQGTHALGCDVPGQLTHCGVMAHPDQGVRNEYSHLIRSATNLVALLADPGVTHRPSADIPESRRSSECRRGPQGGGRRYAVSGDQALGVVGGQRHARELQE